MKKKGLIIIVSFIALILIISGVLFWYHQNQMENGILFTVKVSYTDKRDITYAFYNKSGKIEKIENQNGREIKTFLPKKDYNTVKLLRKLTKKIKGTKEASEEEGFIIFEKQPKKYYYLSYEDSKDLIDIIEDGFLHQKYYEYLKLEMPKEIYVYEPMVNKKTTKPMLNEKDPIISTYKCITANCSFESISNNLTILKDDKYYLYDYVTYTKEELPFDIKSMNLKLLENKQHVLKGLELTDIETKKKAYYDLKEKKVLKEFQDCFEYQIMDEEIFINTKEKIRIESLKENKILWEKENFDEKAFYEVEKLSQNNNNYYVISKNEKIIFVLNKDFKEMEITKNIDSIGIDSNGNLLMIKEDKLIETNEIEQIINAEPMKKVLDIINSYILKYEDKKIIIINKNDNSSTNFEITGIIDINSFDKKDNYLYFETVGLNSKEKIVYQINLKNMEIKEYHY